MRSQRMNISLYLRVLLLTLDLVVVPRAPVSRKLHASAYLLSPPLLFSFILFASVNNLLIWPAYHVVFESTLGETGDGNRKPRLYIKKIQPEANFLAFNPTGLQAERKEESTETRGRPVFCGILGSFQSTIC